MIYTCSAEYIGFVLPKRKWWDFSKRPREKQLEFVENFSGEEIEIQVRILENGPLEYSIYMPSAYRIEICQEFVKQSRKKKKYEVLLVVGHFDSQQEEFLIKNAEDMNYLAIYTEEPETYEYALAKLEQEYGLFGMVFTQYRDFVQYQRQVCEGRNVLVFMGEGAWADNKDGRRGFCRFPKGSRILDFDEVSAYRKMFHGKSMENDYVSLPIFLDNIVKNRYNSVVNEGLQKRVAENSQLQQNVYRAEDKNKLSEKRKGIKNGRKEEYLNL